MKMSVALAVACLTFGVAIANDSAASIKKHELNISRQTLDSALKDLARQTGLQIARMSDQVDGSALVGPLNGTLTTEEALKSLLGAQGLTFRIVNDTTIAVVRRGAETASVLRHLEERMAGSSIQLAQATNGGSSATGATVSGGHSAAQNGSASAAATAADSDVGVEEVIVTAQKKAQSVIDVPISMSVLGEQDLEAMRVQDVEDFIFTIPNATYNRSQVELTKITLRGVGGNSGGRFSPTVVTVDDAVFGFTSPGSLLSSRLLDAERIEILRGPQGTITGASAMGGVINIITKKPSSDGLRLDGTLDVSRFDTYLVKASANLPASDRLAFRATAYYENSGGAVRNFGPSGGDSGYNNRGGRLAVRFKPTDRLTLDASYLREEQRLGLKNSLYIDRDVPFGVTRQQAIDQLAAVGADYFAGSFITDVGNNGGNWFTDIDEHTDLDNDILSAGASLDLGQHSVSFVYGKYTSRSFSLRDRDKSELALNYQRQSYDYDTDSAEIKLLSNYAGPLNWVAGVSYGKEEQRINSLQENGDGTIGGAYPRLRFILRALGKLETYGAFGNVFWDISDRLHFTAGARWSKSESLSDLGRSTSYAIPIPPYPGAVQASISQVDPRVALNFDLSQSVTAYLQYATGFRVGYGQYDPRATGTHTTDLGVIDVPSEIGNERVENYEIGLKGRFFEGRASLTAALFHIDYTDLQIFGGTIVDLDEPVGFDLNAGKAWSRGFEVEGALRPVRGLDLTASVGYVETRLKSLLGQDVAGSPSIADVRPWTAAATARYHRPISASLTGNIQAVYNWQAKADPGFNVNYDTFGLPSFSTLDLSVGVSGSKWTVTGYFNNLFDDIYWFNDVGGISRRGVEAYFVPRTYGLRATVQF